jgi:hypothetical protein
MVGLSIATHQHITHQHGGFENNMQAKLGDENVKRTFVCDYPTK